MAMKDKTEPVRAAAELLVGLTPGDALESMLAEQMAAVHEAALRATGRAAECREQPQIEALYLRQAARLMHLFVRQAEALDRRRAAAGKRAEEQALEAGRKARVEASERREDEILARKMGITLAQLRGGASRPGGQTASSRRPRARAGPPP